MMRIQQMKEIQSIHIWEVRGQLNDPDSGSVLAEKAENLKRE